MSRMVQYNTCLTYFVCRETVIFLLFLYCLILCEIFCLLFNFVLNFQDLKKRLEHMYVVTYPIICQETADI